jgi:hypothetical protein
LLDLRRLLVLTVKNRRSLQLLWLRVFRLFRSPARAYYILRGLATTLRLGSRERPLWFYFKFWLFNWSNAILKYATLSDADFDVESVPQGYAVDRVLPGSYEVSRHERIPETKVRAQRRVTAAALRQFVEARVERA